MSVDGGAFTRALKANSSNSSGPIFPPDQVTAVMALDVSRSTAAVHPGLARIRDTRIPCGNSTRILMVETGRSVGTLTRNVPPPALMISRGEMVTWALATSATAGSTNGGEIQERRITGLRSVVMGPLPRSAAQCAGA